MAYFDMPLDELESYRPPRDEPASTTTKAVAATTSWRKSGF